MRKKVEKVIPKENLLGFESESDLYNKLLEKSNLVFPEYKEIAKMAISRLLTNLIVSGLYFGDKLVKFEGDCNRQLFKYFTKLADNDFIIYEKRKDARLLKLNVDKIKKNWLGQEEIKIEPKESLLGCTSEADLYDKLLKKSALVFPEYGLTERKGVSKHLTNLIVSGKYVGEKLERFSYNYNRQLAKHLENLALKGFVIYSKGQNKSVLKLDTEKIKKDWLNIEHQKTNNELEREAFKRAKIAADKILDMRKKENCFDIACRFEFLLADLKSNK